MILSTLLALAPAVQEPAIDCLDAKFDPAQDDRPGYFDTLLAAQRAWLDYRDKHCTSAGYSMRGWSAEPMVVSGCQAELTDARTQQLKALIEEY